MRDEMDVDETEAARTVQVTVYRSGSVLHRELCESELEAQGVIERWNEVDGTEFEIDDLAVRHGPTDILEPTESVLDDR
jgi:hypothetical protein